MKSDKFVNCLFIAVFAILLFALCGCKRGATQPPSSGAEVDTRIEADGNGLPKSISTRARALNTNAVSGTVNISQATGMGDNSVHLSVPEGTLVSSTKIDPGAAVFVVKTNAITPLSREGVTVTLLDKEEQLFSMPVGSYPDFHSDGFLKHKQYNSQIFGLLNESGVTVSAKVWFH